MKERFIGGLLVTLARLVPGQVGLMYKVMTAEDVESSLRLWTFLFSMGKIVRAYRFGDEVTLLTDFASIEEAERFLVAA